jgi:hypothetical protein
MAFLHASHVHDEHGGYDLRQINATTALAVPVVDFLARFRQCSIDIIIIIIVVSNTIIRSRRRLDGSRQEVVSGKGMIAVGRGGVVGFGRGPNDSGTRRVVLRLDIPTSRKRSFYLSLSLSGRRLIVVIRFGVGSFVAPHGSAGANVPCQKDSLVP